MLPLPDANHTITDAALTQLRSQAVQEITTQRGTEGIRDLAAPYNTRSCLESPAPPRVSTRPP